MRQLSQHTAYRWFDSVTAGLYVWQNGRQIERFEYRYDKPQNEPMRVWGGKKGFKHLRIDDGEASPVKNQSPMID